MIIAIDGPAGSGKSTTARAVARVLGFRHLDSGAFYRALTYAALRAKIAADQWPWLTDEQLDQMRVTSEPAEEGFRMLVGGEDVSTAIRSAEVNAHVSEMARVPAVRGWLLERLRAAARGTDLVSDGRDVGTVIFPDAELKIFLTANMGERARRRLLDQGIDPGADQVSEESDRLGERDRIDSEREVAPLRQADDAIVIDTTALTFEEQVAAIVELARERGAEGSR